jgi:hypothetical protein
MNTTIAPEHLAAIVVLAAHRASTNRPVALARAATQTAAGTVVVALVLGAVVLSVIGSTVAKAWTLFTDFLRLTMVMASALLTIVVVILGAGIVVIHH